MAGPSSLIVNLRFNPPEIEIVGPILESTVLKLGSLLPRMTSLSRNRARKELPQFQKEVLIGVSLSANNTYSASPADALLQQANNSKNNNNNGQSSGFGLIAGNNNNYNSNASAGGASPSSISGGISKAHQQRLNAASSSSPVVWRLELPFSMANDVSQMQMMHAIVECIDEEGIWDMRDSTAFTSTDEGVDYSSLIFVKKPKRKEL